MVTRPVPPKGWALGICPKSIHGIVYVAAVVPFPGEKPFALLESNDESFENPDEENNEFSDKDSKEKENQGIKKERILYLKK